MKRSFVICAVIGGLVGAAAGVVAPAEPETIFEFLGSSAAHAHDDSHPESMQAVLPGQFFAEVSGVGANPVIEQRIEYATNCRYTIRSSRTSAVGICYNWSGSGSWKFQVAALMYDGCARYVWYYGNVGWPWVPGKNTTAKWSYVYSPPGGVWYIVAAKIIIYKP